MLTVLQIQLVTVETLRGGAQPEGEAAGSAGVRQRRAFKREDKVAYLFK